MDKDKSSGHGGGGLLPPSGRSSVKSEPSGSFSLPPLGPSSAGASESGGHFGIGRPSDSTQFSYDISCMPDNPRKHMGHRRAHSEILTLPDDISFDSDLGVVGGFDGPSLSDETEEDLFSMFLDMDKINASSATSAFQAGESSSSGAMAQTPASGSLMPTFENVSPAASERPRVRHQHSQSMDGSTTIKAEMLTSGSEEQSPAELKKAMSAAKLAELALIDPKRAKRIWANRQSAARSKERKMRYIAELERKVQTLQTEATSLSAQLTLLQRDTNGLTAENSELKVRLQTMEQQVNLQDALNDALREEIQHLKVLTGQGMANGGAMMNFPPSSGANHQQFYRNNQAMHTLLTTQQFQQLQINSQKQLHSYQLHQLQQLQHHQSQEQHLHQSGDMKLRNSLSVSGQSENPSDGSSA
ncbi:PREDICTED: probable transcription factor PosF21 [Ipomoea nil]|uniref:probable transcription factor PosF21 n=1 Tax=Ipomoea nil TaxID=35883 RepID=UPI000900DC6F|nr:PREDICTED: probable transcription factor PosF21 [Ipomoea nil]XP_019165786.1 PREDICTED: probable transcription factor PosF21 [Ipomoea nil]